MQRDRGMRAAALVMRGLMDDAGPVVEATSSGIEAAGERQLARRFAGRGAAAGRFSERAGLGQRALCRCRYRPDDDYECVCAIESAMIAVRWQSRVRRARWRRSRKRSAARSTFLPDSPVTLVSADWGESSATARGGAFLLDVHAALSLRNSSQRRIRAVTLAVLAQEVTPGGKGSVSIPSLDVAPGETFPVPIDLPLLRPLGAGQRTRWWKSSSTAFCSTT